MERNPEFHHSHGLNDLHGSRWRGKTHVIGRPCKGRKPVVIFRERYYPQDATLEEIYHRLGIGTEDTEAKYAEQQARKNGPSSSYSVTTRIYNMAGALQTEYTQPISAQEFKSGTLPENGSVGIIYQHSLNNR